MSTTHHAPVEFLGPDQLPTNPNSVVIREFVLPKYYVESTGVIVEPHLDSTLGITFTGGELQGTSMETPSYAFQSPTGQTLTLASANGTLTLKHQ